MVQNTGKPNYHSDRQSECGNSGQDTVIGRGVVCLDGCSSRYVNDRASCGVAGKADSNRVINRILVIRMCTV